MQFSSILPIRILGIDPGLATIGIGLVEATSPQDLQALDWLTITTPAKTPLADRLAEIQKDLSAYIEEQKPELAVIEKLYFSTNERTALDVAHARGVILATVHQHNLPMIEPTPMQLKSSITGDGSADKLQMQEMVKMTLKLAEIPKPDDAADALGLALYGAFHSSGVIADQIPSF